MNEQESGFSEVKKWLKLLSGGAKEAEGERAGKARHGSRNAYSSNQGSGFDNKSM